MFLLCVAYMNQPCFCYQVYSSTGTLSSVWSIYCVIEYTRKCSPSGRSNPPTRYGATNRRAYTRSSELLRRVTERSSTREDTDFFSKRRIVEVEVELEVEVEVEVELDFKVEVKVKVEVEVELDFKVKGKVEVEDFDFYLFQ
ncbi:hypothetical protein F5879DRAFT_922117 [Lentinula edodes]|nr:hypothetical protein F5879DRAFT_922117 [Lentinula edodes]